MRAIAVLDRTKEPGAQGEPLYQDVLTALHEEDVLFHTGVRSLTIKDLFGNTLCFAEEAWVKKPPAVTYGKESGDRQWVIECAELLIHAGGGIAI